MAKEFTLEELASLTGAILQGNPKDLVSGVDDLSNATDQDVSFLANPRYHSQMQKSLAGLICIGQNVPTEGGKNFLISNDPSKTFQQIVNAMLISEDHASGFSDIHDSAVIHPSVKIGENVSIGPNAVIDQNVVIGKNTKIYPNVYVGSGTKIGDDCILHATVVVRERTIIGNRVILQPGAIIGSCGYGYISDNMGKHHKLDQLGIVVIEDDVEVGACTTIDRARFKETRICKGTKIDNLVQIAHNVTIGENNILISQVGIAGSSKTGRNVVIGGQSGIVGHLSIADFVMICSRSGISRSIDEKGVKIGGAPGIPLADWRRKEIHLNQIAKYAKKIKQLEQKIEELEKSLQNQ